MSIKRLSRQSSSRVTRTLNHSEQEIKDDIRRDISSNIRIWIGVKVNFPGEWLNEVYIKSEEGLTDEKKYLSEEEMGYESRTLINTKTEKG